MKTREARFFGDGNSSVEGEDGQRKKTWRVRCCSCGAEEHMRLARGFLPPDIVLKKFRQKGWMIGTKPEDDLCAQCRSPAPAEPPPQEPQQPQKDAGSLGSIFQEQFKNQVEENARLRSDNQSLRELTEYLQDPQERCCFCGKYPDEVVKLIRGTALSRSVYICEGCVGTCAGLLSSAELPSDLLRAVHESLISGAVANALQKIEAAFPRWPWPKRLPKRKGSIKPAPARMPDPEFDRWLEEQERERRAALCEQQTQATPNGAHAPEQPPDEAKYKFWTDADLQRLRAGAECHERAESIAKALFRTEGSVRQKAFEQGLSLDSRTPGANRFWEKSPLNMTNQTEKKDQ
jgi:ClpX C4-type zinc finger